MEYKKYADKELKFEYKTFLSEAEYAALIQVGLDSFIYGLNSDEGRIEDGIPFYRFNPISMEREYFRTLCFICIKDIDAELFDKIFNKGIHVILKNTITNADDAYNLLKTSADKLGGLENILDVNLKALVDKLGDKIPNKDVLENLLKVLPGELGKLKEMNKDE